MTDIKRLASRHLIIDLANTVRIHTQRRFSMGSVQEAVFVARQRGLVDSKMLSDAGFSPKPLNQRVKQPRSSGTATRTPKGNK